MDDFGTGYSSLSYLRSFPFDKIKIDRSFIQDISSAAEPLAIVHAVAGLAKCLNMVSTAEGVETQQQMETLQNVGCTEMQGYFFSKAKPAAEIVGNFLQPGMKVGGRIPTLVTKTAQCRLRSGTPVGRATRVSGRPGAP